MSWDRLAAEVADHVLLWLALPYTPRPPIYFPTYICTSGVLHERMCCYAVYCSIVPRPVVLFGPPVSTCGNTFDYSTVTACASFEGSAASSTLCSSGVNGCDDSLCCVPRESTCRYGLNRAGVSKLSMKLGGRVLFFSSTRAKITNEK